jgi:putative ABC transport system permease protein
MPPPLPSPAIFADLVWGQAFRALFRHKSQNALTALGIAVGIAAVVWVVALAQSGAQRSEDQLRALGDNLVWVEAGARNVAGVRTGTHGATSLTIEDARAIAREIPLINRISPQIDGALQIVSSERNWTTRYRGVSPDYLAIKRWDIAEGSAFSDEDVEQAANVCVLGKTVRDRLFGPDDPIGQVVRMGPAPFVVIGVFAPKGQSATGQDQDDVVMLPHTTAQRRLRDRNLTWLDDIVCSAATPGDVAPAIDRVTDLMRQRHRIEDASEDDFNIRKPEELLKAQLETQRTFGLLLVSIACVSLLVGGVGVMNMMLASVTERTREIGLRRAIGATGFAVQLQFLAEAVVLCLLGGAAGVLLSVAGASGFERALGWAIHIPVGAVVLALAFSVLVGLVFGSYPAWRASRLDPIEALRSE